MCLWKLGCAIVHARWRSPPRPCPPSLQPPVPCTRCPSSCPTMTFHRPTQTQPQVGPHATHSGLAAYQQSRRQGRGPEHARRARLHAGAVRRFFVLDGILGTQQTANPSSTDFKVGVPVSVREAWPASKVAFYSMLSCFQLQALSKWMAALVWALFPFLHRFALQHGPHSPLSLPLSWF